MIKVYIFLLAVAALYAAAAWIVIAWLVRRRSPQRKPATRVVRWLRAAVVALAGAGILCGLYARFIEPYWLEVNRVEIATGKLPAGAEEFRIVQISDMHCDGDVRLEDDLPEVISNLKPDVIVFTGDAANSGLGADNFRTCMKNLAEIAPVYAVRGNWDQQTFYEDPFADTPIRLLDGEAVQLTGDGGGIWLCGAGWRRPEKMKQALAAAPKNACRVLLYHYPGGVFRASKAGADIMLSGHTHGGQVALPIYGAIVTFSGYGKRLEHGRYEIGDTTLYINRGIGMEGGGAPRIRFCARPEVTLIIIRGKE